MPKTSESVEKETQNDSPGSRSTAIGKVGGSLEAQSIFKSPYFPDSYVFPYNPDEFCSGNNYDIYDEMLMDDQVKAAMSVKKDMVVSTGWEIDCEDKKVKDFVSESLKNIHQDDPMQSTFDDALRDMLSAYEYGFSVAEPVYALGEDGLYKHRSLLVRPPHTFIFNLDDYGRLTTIEQMTSNGPKKFTPDVFLHHAYQTSFGNPYGKSDLQSAHRAWKAKGHFVKMWCIYGERFASPTIVGSYEPGTDPNEVDKLFTILKKIQNNTTLVVPKGTQIEFIQAEKDSGDFYERAVSAFNLWIARAILVPDLLGMSGEQTSGGSRALGSTQFEVFLSTISKDRESLAKKITLKLIRPLVLANFGDIPCTFKFKPYGDEQLSEHLKIWADVVKAKVYDPNPEEIAHFRQMVKFPEGPVSISERPEIDLITGLPMPRKAGVMDKKPGEMDDGPEKKKPGKFVKTFMRPVTHYEAKIDFARVERDLDASERSLKSILRDTARRVFTDLVEQIRDRGIIGKHKPEAIADVHPRFLKDMNVEVKRAFKGMFRDSLDEARTELFPSGKKNFVSDDMLPKEFLDILDAETFEIVGGYSTDITKRAKALLVRGMKDGTPEGKLVGLIREELTANTDRWVSTLSRTKTTEIYNAARKTYWDTDPIASKIIEAYQFSAILDERTSGVCEYLDGKIFEKGDFTSNVTPPLHFNCRSLLVPVTKYEDYKADKAPSLESLVERGAGLLAAGKGYAKNNFSLDVQRLEANIELSSAGNHIVIPQSEPGKGIKVCAVNVSNNDLEFPVQIGFREGAEGQPKFTTVLPPLGGVFVKEFEPSGWLIPAGLALHISTSAATPVSVCVDYEIVDLVIPVLSAVSEVRLSGTHAIIAPPEDGARIRVYRVNVSNLDFDFPVQVAFHEGRQGQAKFPTVLPKSGGVFAKDFGADGWLVAEATPIYVSTNDSVRVAITIDYDIANLNGERLR